MSLELLLAGASIFILRLVDMSLDTLRVLYVLRGKKGLVWVLGFFQALVFILAITSVLQDIGDPLRMISYAAGFATGNVIGILIEERLAVGYSHLRIISSTYGKAIAAKLRQEGFAVTEVPASGRDGMVTLLNCNVLRRHTRKVGELVLQVDGNAFITTEDVRPVARGFWRA